MPPRRLGVRRAYVDRRWIDGDIAVDVSGAVVACGLAPLGSGPARQAIPALVDVQVNGMSEIDVVGSTVGELVELATRLRALGTGAFLPTVHSASVSEYVEALGNIAIAKAITHGRGDVAQILGAHLEGPFLSSTWAGAHDPDRLKEPHRDLVQILLSGGPIAMMTLAPEEPGAAEVIDRLVAAGSVVALGHSDAPAKTVQSALDRGARFHTHCFNAHRQLSSREPGPAGVSLTDERCYVGIIGDGVHLSGETVRLAYAAAGQRAVLSSDLVAGQGSTTDSEGVERLGGSTVDLLSALAHVIDLGVDSELAVGSATVAPLAMLGIRAASYRPTMVVVDDSFALVQARP